MKNQLLCRIMSTISEASLKNNVRTGERRQGEPQEQTFELFLE